MHPTPAQLRALNAGITDGELPDAIPAAPPVRRRKRDNQEFRIQSAFAKLWRANCASLGFPQCVAFHIPNGSVMGGGSAPWQKTEREIRGRLQKLAGVEDGVCDYFISVPRHGYHGMYVEFKRPDKGTVSPEQWAFIDAVRAQGYHFELHVDAVIAWEAAKKYLTT
jgi:hypothetical protein